MSEYFRKPIVKTLMLKGEKGETGDSDYKPAVDALGKRIDNLILSSGTESSAEVVDARNGYDGTTYDTLGTAIRSQVSELKSDLVELDNSYPLRMKTNKKPLEMSFGAVLPDGTLDARDTRCHSDYIDIETDYEIFVNDLYVNTIAFWTRVFDSNKNIITSVYADEKGNIYEDAQSKSNPIKLSKIKGLISNAKYVRIVGVDKTNMQNRLDISLPYIMIDYKNIVVDTLDNNYLCKITEIVDLECGGIDGYTGKIDLAGNGYESAKNRIRSGKFLCVLPNTEMSIEYTYNNLVVFEYDKNFNFIRCQKLVDKNNGTLTFSSNTNYVKFLYQDYTKNILKEKGVLKITYLSRQNTPIYVSNIRTGNVENFCFEVDGDKNYTSCYLKLPTNYSNKGKKVPLIIYVQSSGDYAYISSPVMSNYYSEYLQFLSDNGYAIVSVYPWAYPKYDGTKPYGAYATPTTVKCYRSGLEYVLSHYNLDENNVFVMTKSLGGLLSSILSCDRRLNIKASGLLAPELDMFYAEPFGYHQDGRMFLGTDFGLDDNEWESIFNVSNSNFSHDRLATYLNTHGDKFSGYNPTWYGLNSPLTEKITNSINRTHNDESCRFGFCPIKIWHSEDDDATSYEQSSALIQTIKNGGGVAELRTMPNGTGGHHSVDNDAKALQTTNITTLLGVHYDTIPTAYYELWKWFEKHRTN